MQRKSWEAGDICTRFGTLHKRMSIRHILTNFHRNLIGIATHPNHLRKGVASALIAWGVKEAEKQNIPVLIESVPHARPLYLSNGFTENGKWTIDYEEKDAHGNQTGQKKTITLYMMIRETK